MKVTALLTGRGNNTLKDKNIRNVLGNPVLYYPAKAGYSSSEVTNWYCSSDDEKILHEAEKVGYQRILRPQELALPTSQHVDSILHGLDIMKEEGNLPDILVVILANNVTIKSEWISECVRMMKRNMSISSVVPVCIDNDHHPLRAKKLNKDGSLEMYESNSHGKISTNRQELPPCYFIAHNFWVLNVDYLLSGKEGQKPWEFMGNKIMPYEIEQSIDIHEEIDLYIAKEWIRKNYTD